MEEIKPPRLLVIGGTGFIGSHLLRGAIRKGWDSSSLSLHAPSNDRYVEGVEYFQCSLSDIVKLDSIVSCGFDYVVNLGGYIDHKKYNDGGRELIDSHFTGLLNLVQALPKDGLKCFVQVGSSDEYGDAASPQHEKLRERPISPYSLGKVASTHFLQMLHRTDMFPAVIVRLFLTYGPGQNTNRFLPQIITGCLKNKKFPVSEGAQLRDFCFVDDVVKAILMALSNRNAIGEIFNVASGSPVTIRSMIETVQQAIGSGEAVFGEIPYRVGENMELYADIDKVSKVLGWQPQITLTDGLIKTVDWYANRT